MTANSTNAALEQAFGVIMQRLQATQPAMSSLCIAYSGGLDSTVLLYLCQRWCHSRQIPIRFLHVNHRLHAQAAQWQRHCEAMAAQWNIPGVSLQLPAFDSKKKGLEAAAREARYQMLLAHTHANEAIVLAQHLNDQAETVLLQLLRGAGPKGLAAMSEVSSLHGRMLWRPLLTFQRQALELYAHTHELSWIEDSSNQDTRLRRNFLRHEIIPRLATHWPNAPSLLARAANHCREADKQLDAWVAKQWRLVSPMPDQCDLSALQAYSLSQQLLLLRHWLRSLMLPIPHDKQLRLLVQTMTQAHWDKSPCCRWPGVEVHRFKNKLYAMATLSPVDLNWQQEWGLHQPCELPFGLGMLKATLQPGQGFVLPAGAAMKVTLRFRQEGERFHPLGRQHSHPLKKLFQSWQVPPWQRDRIPLVTFQQQLVAVPGLSVAQDFAVQGDQPGWVIEQLNT